MRRLYIAPQAVILEHKDYFCPRIGHHGVMLFTHPDPDSIHLSVTDPAVWEALPEVVAWRAAGSPMLLSTTLEHSESQQDLWHNHPEVAILPHPTFEGNLDMTACVQKPNNKFCNTHLEHLSCIGIDGSHTVLDIADKACKLSPEVKLSSVF